MLYGKSGFKKSDNSCSSLKMTHISFYRSHEQRIILRSIVTVDCIYGIYFNRITKGSSGSMGLQVVHLTRIYTRICQGLPDHSLLCQFIGYRKAATGPVMVYR